MFIPSLLAQETLNVMVSSIDHHKPLLVILTPRAYQDRFEHKKNN